MHWRIRALTLGIVAAACSACTVIEIQESQESVRIERRFGFSSIVVANDLGFVVGKVRSLGYIASPLGISVGASRQTVLLSDGDCRVTLWIEGDRTAPAVYEYLKNIPSVCVVD